MSNGGIVSEIEIPLIKIMASMLRILRDRPKLLNEYRRSRASLDTCSHRSFFTSGGELNSLFAVIDNFPHENKIISLVGSMMSRCGNGARCTRGQVYFCIESRTFGPASQRGNHVYRQEKSRGGIESVSGRGVKICSTTSSR